MPSDRPRVWVSRPLFADIVDRLREFCDVEAETETQSWTPDQIAQKLRGKNGALLGPSDPLDRRTIEALTQLRAVANVAVGYNNLDLAALAEKNIIATNTPDVLNEAVADFAWALMLATARRVGEAERFLRSGKWKDFAFDLMLGADLHGRTLGILGMGRIGQAIARRAIGFRMSVLYHNRSRLEAQIERESSAHYVSKEQLLRDSDFLILVLPFIAANRHAIGATELNAMKSSAILVNIARGGIVDDAALVDALKQKTIAAAGLDVFENEPTIHPELQTLDNVVLTPHIASASISARRAMANLAVDNLIAALGFGPTAGNPPNVIRPTE